MSNESTTHESERAAHNPNKNVHNEKYLICVGEQIPSLGECYDFVLSNECGAVSTFVGTTRDNFQGKGVEKLCYEGYVPMAEKHLYRLCDQAVSLYGGEIKKIAIVHVLGACPVGTPSVIIAASSPHRTDAIKCVEYLINELKATIPIWKNEVYDGDHGQVWKENVEWGRDKKGETTSKRVMVPATEQAK